VTTLTGLPVNAGMTGLKIAVGTAPGGVCPPTSLEDQPADRVESRFECFSGPAVVGVQDSPGLDVGDNAFDGGAESVDDRVIGLAVVAEFGAWRFLGRADDLASLGGFKRS